MGRTGKRKWGWLAGMVLAGVTLMIGGWRVWPHKRLLLEVARPIVPLDITCSAFDSPPNEQAYWLSTNRLLIFTADQGTPGEHVDLFDIPSHTRTHLNGLTHLLRRPNTSLLGARSNWELSPRGTWLHVAQESVTSESGYESLIVKCDGSQYRHIRDPDNLVVGFWLDDQHYVEGYSEESQQVAVLNVSDVEHPANDRHYSAFDAMGSKILSEHYDAHPTRIEMPLDYRYGDPLSFEIEEYCAQGRDASNVQPLHIYKIALPKDVDRLMDALASPQQTTIIYNLQIARTSDLLTWLHRVVPSVSVKPVITEELWISKSDGQGMREIGHVPGKVDANGDPEDQLNEVQWLPDGKQVSFIYRDMLYVVPAEMKALR